MKLRFLLASLLLSCGGALANDASLLLNGAFDQGSGEGMLLSVPKHWFVTGLDVVEPNSWVRILDVSENGTAGVELKGASVEAPQFLYQDVETAIHEKGPYLLRWKAKGTGMAEIAVAQREGSGSFTPSSKRIDLAPSFESHEIPLTIPEDADYVRVIVRPASAEAEVIISQVELVPAK